MGIGTDQIARLLEATKTTKIKDLAAIIGAAPNKISMWKQRGLPEGEAYRISQMLGRPALWLLTGGQESETDAIQKQVRETLAPYTGKTKASDDAKFLAEIYDRLDPDRQHALLTTASAMLSSAMDEKGGAQEGGKTDRTSKTSEIKRS